MSDDVLTRAKLERADDSENDCWPFLPTETANALIALAESQAEELAAIREMASLLGYSSINDYFAILDGGN